MQKGNDGQSSSFECVIWRGDLAARGSSLSLDLDLADVVAVNALP